MNILCVHLHGLLLSVASSGIIRLLKQTSLIAHGQGEEEEDLGASRGLLALAISAAAPGGSWCGTARRVKASHVFCSAVSALPCSSDGDSVELVFRRK